MANWQTDIAVEAFLAAGFEDGEIISYKWLTQALDVQDRHADGLTWLSRVYEFKQALLKGHNLYFETVQGQGLRLVPPEEQSEVAARKWVGEITRSYHRAADAFKFIRAEALTSEELQRHREAETRLHRAQQMQRNSRANIYLLFHEGLGHDPR